MTALEPWPNILDMSTAVEATTYAVERSSGEPFDNESPTCEHAAQVVWASSTANYGDASPIPGPA